MIADDKVRRVHASLIPATVTDELTPWQAAMRDRPGDSVRVLCAAANGEFTVSVGMPTAFPLPALVVSSPIDERIEAGKGPIEGHDGNRATSCHDASPFISTIVDRATKTVDATQSGHFVGQGLKRRDGSSFGRSSMINEPHPWHFQASALIARYPVNGDGMGSLSRER